MSIFLSYLENGSSLLLSLIMRLNRWAGSGCFLSSPPRAASATAQLGGKAKKIGYGKIPYPIKLCLYFLIFRAGRVKGGRPVFAIEL
jgi:hypothetical protein